MSKRSMSLTSLVQDTSNSLAEFAKWPTVEARRIAADISVSELRSALHGYDPIVPRSVMLSLIADMLDYMFVRDIPIAGMRLAFDKMLDICDPQKQKEKEKETAKAE